VSVEDKVKVSREPRVEPFPAESLRTTLRTTPNGFAPSGEVFIAVKVADAGDPVVVNVAFAVVSPAT